MLTELTLPQVMLLQDVKDEWLEHFFSLKFDEEKARQYVDFLYDLVKKPTPKKILLDSPMALQIVCNLLIDDKSRNSLAVQVGDQIYNQVTTQVRDQVCDQVSAQISDQIHSQVRAQVIDQARSQIHNQVITQVRDQVRDQVSTKIRDHVRTQVRAQVRAQVSAQVRAQVFDQARNQVCDQVGKESFFKQLKVYFYESYEDAVWNCARVSFYDYFSRIGVVKHALFEQYRDGIQSNIFALIFQEYFCLISRPPIHIHRDEQGNMHCTIDAAIKFRDGFGLHYLWGVYFSPENFQKYVINRVSPKELFAITNQEQQAALIKLYGYEKLLEDLTGLKIVDKLEKQGKMHILYSWILSERVHPRFLMVDDFSTDRKYFIGVPGHCKTAFEALAWTFNVPTEKYAKIVIET